LYSDLILIGELFMTESTQSDAEDLRRLRESSADALLQRYEEKVNAYRNLYQKTMADALESILEVEIARRLGDEALVAESKAQAIANLEEADLAKEKYENYERRLAALEALLDEEDGLEGAFARYLQPEN
jgi:hypothetical protein